MVNLELIWTNLTAKYITDSVVVNKLWQEIKSSYTAPGRHYHNLDHLEYMLNLAEVHKDQIQDIDTLRFAIFYHDIVYVPGSANNEQKSAELARLRLDALRVPTAMVNRCCEQILATRKHEPTKDNDTRYLLDFDLAILGDDLREFEDYTQKIKREFSAIPPLLFAIGRKAFVKKFLSRERIYQTSEFFKEREQKARDNLERLSINEV